MTRQRDLSCLLLAALLLVYTVLATWYSLVIPLGEAPDEVDHFGVIRYIGQHQRLPTTEEEHEAVQPPLYYLAATALTFWIPDHVPFATWANADFDLGDPRAPRNLLLHPAAEAWPFRGWALSWHLVRLISVALGAVTVWAIFHLGRELFPERPEIALGMAALTAFTPQFLFMTAVVSNDNAATALSALVLWQVAVLLQRNALRASRLALLGLLLGLGLLSKSNTIALVPVGGLAILIVWWRQASRQVRALFSSWLIALGLAAAVSGWYYVRNLIVFGDPLGLSFVLATNPLRPDPVTPGVLLWLVRGMSRSFWLGWIGIELDGGLYWLINALCLVAAGAFLTWLAARWRRIATYVRWTVVMLGLHAVLTFASLLRWTAIVGGTDQGRLIYPLMPTVMLILAGGLLLWLPARIRPWGAGSLAAAWLILAVITPGRYLQPIYAPDPTVEALPANVSPLEVTIGGSLQLAGYHLENTLVRPGEKLALHLYWKAADRPEANLWTLIELVDENGSFLMYKDGSPSAGLDTTDRWMPGRIVASEHRLSIPEAGQPGTYRLVLRVHPAGERTWLPLTGADGTAMGDTFTLAVPVEIAAP